MIVGQVRAERGAPLQRSDRGGRAPGRGAPEEVRFETLEDWTHRPEEGIRHYSGKAVYQDGIKSIKHPMDADTTHDSSGEYYWAAFGNQLAKTNGGTGTRHANCQGCHDPHDAQHTREGGTVSASTTTTLTDSTKNGRWTASQWVGSILYVPSLAAGQNTRSITASTAAGVLTVAAWTAAPAVGSAYYIYDNKADGGLQGSWGARLSSTPAL